MHLHREGYKSVAIVLTIAILLSALLWFLGNLPIFMMGTLALLCFVLFVSHFFRSPRRNCVESDSMVYSPCDGRVVAVERVHEPEVFGDDRIQVSVFMSVWNVHINWYPIAGHVSYAKYHKGKFLVAWHPKSSTDNERSTIVVDHRNGQQILFRQIAGAVARRIVTHSRVNEIVQQGAEMGFIKFGSRIDVFFPTDADITVRVGDRVRGRVTCLGKLHPQQ